MKHDNPSLQLVPNDGTMEETTTTDTIAPWEQYIINHLISCCDVGGLESTDEENSSSDPEDSDLGYYEDEPAPVAKSKKEKRSRKQKEKQDAGTFYCSVVMVWLTDTCAVGTRPSDEGDSTGKGEKPSCIKSKFDACLSLLVTESSIEG